MDTLEYVWLFNSIERSEDSFIGAADFFFQEKS